MSKKFNVKVQVFSPEELLAKKVGSKLTVPKPVEPEPVPTIPEIQLAPEPVAPVVESTPAPKPEPVPTPAPEPVPRVFEDNIAQDDDEPEAEPEPTPVVEAPKPAKRSFFGAAPAKPEAPKAPVAPESSNSKVIGAALLGLSLLAIAGIRQ